MAPRIRDVENEPAGLKWIREQKIRIDAVHEHAILRRYSLSGTRRATITVAFKRVFGQIAKPAGELIARVHTAVWSGGTEIHLSGLNSDDFARLAGLVGEFERWLKGQRTDLPKED